MLLYYNNLSDKITHLSAIYEVFLQKKTTILCKRIKSIGYQLIMQYLYNNKFSISI